MITDLAIFLCGVATGTGVTILVMTFIQRQRDKDTADANARETLADWRRNNPDIVRAWGEADTHEPTELDQ